jgi:hypothetical protein
LLVGIPLMHFEVPDKKRCQSHVSISRAEGVDLTTGRGLDGALGGVDAVVDVTNIPSTDTNDATRFFAAVSEHLLASEQQVGVMHHVTLSMGRPRPD